MPRVGLEPKISVFWRAKTVHALDREATVTGTSSCYPNKTEECVYRLRT
jgi:hypothetical protein